MALLVSSFPVLKGAPALAGDLTVSSATTTPVATATGNGSGPGNITVDSNGSIVVPTPTSVFVNSSNNFTNLGSIASSALTGARTVFIDVGQTTANNIAGNVTNSNVITGTPDPAGSDYANSSNNTALYLGGLGTFTGNITNDSAGSIVAGGNGSFGIAIRGNMVGNLNNLGTINALGDGSYGILTTGKITGAVTTAGVIAAGGSGSVGAYFGGGIDGQLIHAGAILAGSGPQVTVAANGIDLKTTDPIYARAGLWIGGSVSGGVLLQGNTYTTAQESADPTLVANATVTDSSISMVGPGPALLFAQGGPAANTNIVIGPNTANTSYSVVSQGNITSAGTGSGTTALGIEVAGLSTGGQTFTTTLSKGFYNQGGTIDVTAVDARATAFHVGNYGSVSQLVNGGDMFAITSDSTANSITGFVGSKGGDAYGVLVDPLGTLSSFTNTGNLTVSASGPAGSAYGVVDKSGTLTSFNNSGAITAAIPAGSLTGHSVAVDLSANTQGLTFTNTGTIFGDVYLGGGTETFTSTGKTISGSVIFQNGASKTGTNTVTLDNAIITDKMYLGNGNHTLTLNNNSQIQGGVSTGTGATTLTVNQSKVSLVGDQPFNASTATFSSGSSLTFNLSSVAPAAPVLKATGAVNFAAGSTVTAAFTGILTSTQNYTLIQAGSLTSGSGVPLSQFATAPSSFLNSASFTSTATSLVLTVRPKTAAELQLGTNETTLYNLFATPVNRDAQVATAISAQGSQDAFARALRQLLPDTSGASVQTALNNQDMTFGEIRRRLVGVAKNGNPQHSSGDVPSFWAQAIGDYSIQNRVGEEQGFDTWGLGIAFGTDAAVGDHTNLGISFVETWHSANLEVSPVSPVQGYTTGGFLYGRSDLGQFYVQGMAGGAANTYNQARHVRIDTTTRIADGKWGGYQYGGALEAGGTTRWDEYSLTPYLRGSYLKMHEDGYTETGGGAAVNLIVSAKDPDASIRGAVGFNLDRDFPVYFDSYIEGEFRANYTREFTHSPIALNASFASGSATFVNVGNPREPNRFTAGFGIAGKDSYSSISLDYDVEVSKGYLAHIAAVTARFRF